MFYLAQYHIMLIQSSIISHKAFQAINIFQRVLPHKLDGFGFQGCQTTGFVHMQFTRHNVSSSLTNTPLFTGLDNYFLQHANDKVAPTSIFKTVSCIHFLRFTVINDCYILFMKGTHMCVSGLKLTSASCVKSWLHMATENLIKNESFIT